MRNMTIISLLGAMVFVVSVGLGQEKPADASAHFKKGVSLFNAGKKEEAVQEFNAAYEAKPSWKILYNIGQCHASLKRYGMAIEAFEKYLGEGGDEVSKDRQDEVLGELDRLRKMVGKVKVNGPDGVEIYIDKFLRGKTPTASGILTTAGIEHQIWLIKDGEKLLSVTETVSGTEVLELTVPTNDAGQPEAVGPLAASSDTQGTADSAGAGDTEPTTEPATGDASNLDNVSPDDADGGTQIAPPEKSGLRPVVFIAVAATAVVFGGAAGGLAGAVNKKWENSIDRIYDDPWTTDTEAVAANIHTMQILGYVSLGIAAAGLIAAVTLIPFTNWKGNKSKRTGALRASPWAEAGSGGLVLEGRF